MNKLLEMTDMEKILRFHVWRFDSKGIGDRSLTCKWLADVKKMQTFLFRRASA